MTVLGPGTRVRCVNHGNGKSSDGCTLGFPTIGSVWTIKKAIDHPIYGEGISLLEWHDHGDYFRPSGFVPLDGNEDISVFTEMLTKLPAPSKLPAPAKLPATPTLVPAS